MFLGHDVGDDFGVADHVVDDEASLWTTERRPLNRFRSGLIILASAARMTSLKPNFFGAGGGGPRGFYQS